MRALIIYASSEGQTEKIAQYLSEKLGENGIPADTYNVVTHSADEIAIDSYDTVLIGSPLHYAEYDSRIEWCIRDNVEILNKLPTGFFSISLGIRSQHAADQHEVVKLTEDFLNELGFEPDVTTYFAGALQYSKYGWIKKRIMRWIANKSGENDKDYSTDHEYTNWAEVDRFARDFAQSLTCIPNKEKDTDKMQRRVHIVHARSRVSLSK